jgi:alcohol dehydrogenase (cytochrome c)
MRRVSRRTAIWTVIAAFVLLAVVGMAPAFRKELREVKAESASETWDRLSWRARFLARKATGGVPELSWKETWQMLQQHGGFGLAGVDRLGLSLEGSVINPFVTEEDRKAGEGLYRANCMSCHAANGVGWLGPRLDRSGLKHGDSDLAIYKTLRDGIPETNMVAPQLTPTERWQLVGYLRTLRVHDDPLRDQVRLNVRVSDEQLLEAGSRTDEWLTYSGSLDSHRYSALKELTPSNVTQLRLKWIGQLSTTGSRVESTPIVVNNVVFVTEPPSNVIALDLKTGRQLWKYTRIVPSKLPLCCGVVNRGVAVWEDTLFLGGIDGYLVALDANSGRLLWQSQVAATSEGYAITGAPLIVNGTVYIGVAGGEYGIRGHLNAYDAMTGTLKWRLNTIPAPGEPGHETWLNDAWRTGGGPTWVTGSYDPALDLLYWGVGNPSPDFSAEVRPGDNLYTDSVIAVHASTGKMAWHFQFTPSDEHDWDSNQTPILADLVLKGTNRKVICWANRNGFYYVLDRVTGAFLAGVPFVEQDWTKGLDAKGRPIPLGSGSVSTEGRQTRPGVGGGTNWQNAAFDPTQSLIFVHATEGSSVFTKNKSPRPIRGDMAEYLASAGSMTDLPSTVVRALDAATGVKKWEHFTAPTQRQTSLLAYSGLLATAGGLIFGGSGGDLFAINSKTGDEVWRVPVGGETAAAPITITIDGRQTIIVSAGRSVLAFGL